MSDTAIQTKAPIDSSIVNALVIKGDLSGLNQEQTLQYYRAFCERVGVDPLAQPFKILNLSGKKVLYCDRSGAQQLNKLHSVSHAITARELIKEVDVYQVTARASTPDGRFTDSIGAVNIAGMKGEAYANAIMKAETKAKRRSTLDLLGLGMLDETEVETIPGAKVELPELPSADELRAEFLELLESYRELVGGTKADKLHPDNWKQEQTQENFIKAISFLKEEVINLTNEKARQERGAAKKQS